MGCNEMNEKERKLRQYVIILVFLFFLVLFPHFISLLEANHAQIRKLEFQPIFNIPFVLLLEKETRKKWKYEIKGTPIDK